LRIWDLRRGDDDDDRTNLGPRSLVFSAALEFNYLKGPIGFLALFVAPALLIGIAPSIAITYVRLVLHAAASSGGSPIVTPVVFWSWRLSPSGSPARSFSIGSGVSFHLGARCSTVPSPPTPEALVVRVAHLSGLHIVGERYGYRMEAGTNSPRCNRVIRGALRKLATIHASTPFDRVLMTGDITDAGTLHSGRSLLTSCAAARSYAGGCRWCRVTTTSTSLIAPTRDAWTCRGARTA
jgi:hypothetical protein